jgi:hypothetical protein
MATTIAVRPLRQASQEASPQVSCQGGSARDFFYPDASRTNYFRRIDDLVNFGIFKYPSGTLVTTLNGSSSGPFKNPYGVTDTFNFVP